MFGILYSLFMSIGVIGHNAKENYYESVRKDKARDSYDRTYFDKKGREILLDNNRWVTSDVVNGHRVLKDVKNGTIYRDFSQEQENSQRENSKTEAINKGKTVYLYERHDKNSLWAGDKYKDIKTGDVYVVRKYVVSLLPYYEVYFFVNIENGKLVRKTDFQVQYDQRFIDDLNNLENNVREFCKSTYKDVTEEEFENIVQEEVIKRRKSIESCYLDETRERKYVEEKNAKREIEKEKNPNSYYGCRVAGCA